MIDFLLGVPGKLKTISDHLTTYWTSARAAKLDYLTANVAVASTAVSNANYTSGRAALLDGIIQNTVINSIQTGYVGAVASAGTGEDARYKDVTITAVTLAKCVVLVQGSGISGGALTARLTSTTNLRISCPVGDTTLYARWSVEEFK